MYQMKMEGGLLISCSHASHLRPTKDHPMFYFLKLIEKQQEKENTSVTRILEQRHTFLRVESIAIGDA